MNQTEIKIEQTSTGYKAFVTFMGLTDEFEHSTPEAMAKDLHYNYGIECSYNEATGELKAYN